MQSIFEPGNGAVRSADNRYFHASYLPIKIAEGVNVPDNKKKTEAPSAPSTPKQEVKSEGSSPASSRKNSIDEAKDVSSTSQPLQPVRRRISTIVNDKEKDPKEVLRTIDAALQEAENGEELVDM